MLKELNSLINVRNFLNISINDLSVNMTSEKSSAVSKKIALLNKIILNMALELDVEKIHREAKGEGESIRSTVEIKNIEELDKLVNLAKPKSSKVKANEMAK